MLERGKDRQHHRGASDLEVAFYDAGRKKFSALLGHGHSSSMPTESRRSPARALPRLRRAPEAIGVRMARRSRGSPARAHRSMGRAGGFPDHEVAVRSTFRYACATVGIDERVSSRRLHEPAYDACAALQVRVETRIAARSRNFNCSLCWAPHGARRRRLFEDPAAGARLDRGAAPEARASSQDRRGGTSAVICSRMVGSQTLGSVNSWCVVVNSHARRGGRSGLLVRGGRSGAHCAGDGDRR